MERPLALPATPVRCCPSNNPRRRPTRPSNSRPQTSSPPIAPAHSARSRESCPASRAADLHGRAGRSGVRLAATEVQPATVGDWPWHHRAVGAWGPAIFSDDTTADIRADLRSWLETGLSDADAATRVLDGHDLSDPRVWLGLEAAHPTRPCANGPCRSSTPARISRTGPTTPPLTATHELGH